MSIAYGPKKIIRAATAGSSHLTTDTGDAATARAPIDLSLYFSASIQLVWAGLTGTIDGVLSVEVSSDGVNWDPKLNPALPAAITVSGAAGNDTISFDQNVTERYYRARWTPNGVTGGTINCILNAKG